MAIWHRRRALPGWGRTADGNQCSVFSFVLKFFSFTKKKVAGALFSLAACLLALAFVVGYSSGNSNTTAQKSPFLVIHSALVAAAVVVAPLIGR